MDSCLPLDPLQALSGLTACPHSREPPGWTRRPRFNARAATGRTTIQPARRLMALRPKTALRGSNQTGAALWLRKLGSYPVYAGPVNGIKRRTRRPRHRQSWTGRPCLFRRLCPHLQAKRQLRSLLSDVPPGCPKGKSSDHHCFAKTRKGVPTNWASTPDRPHLAPIGRFAKGNFSRQCPAGVSARRGFMLPLLRLRAEQASECRPSRPGPWSRRSRRG